MTNQELNEAVAKRLGLEYRIEHGCMLMLDKFHVEREFCPSTDPAAALWALSEWCRKTGTIATSVFPYSNSNPWCFSFGNETPLGSGTFCEAICRVIAGAE